MNLLTQQQLLQQQQPQQRSQGGAFDFADLDVLKPQPQNKHN